MKNKILIATSFIALIAVVYYVFYTLPKKNYLQNSIKCMQDGIKLYEKNNEGREKSEYYDPKFYFVKKTNTCLYWGGYTRIDKADDSMITTYIIKDVYRNLEIASWSSLGEDYSEKYAELYDKYFRGY